MFQRKSSSTELTTTTPPDFNAVTILDDSCFKPATFSGKVWLAYRSKFCYGVSRHWLYKASTEDLDFLKIMELCEMEDSFDSFFTIVHLHMWMLLVRLRLVGHQGKKLSWFLTDLFWKDMQERAKQLGLPSKEKKETFKALESKFYSLMFLYDEAILEDDTVLASAMWDAFFQTAHADYKEREFFVVRGENEGNTLVSVVGMVEYVRKNIQYLETIDSHHLVACGKIKWRSLSGDDDDEADVDDFNPSLLTSSESELPGEGSTESVSA